MAFPDGWSRKQKITIQSSAVAGSGFHSNFPVLVTLDHLDTEVVDTGSNSALNGGGDIRFSSDSTGSTQLACDIVDFVTNASVGPRKCEIWVKLPAVSTSSNTDFYIWYKKSGESQPAAATTYGSEEVWSDWEYRTHDMLSDVTGNNTITEANAGTVTDSPFGSNAYLFDGSDDYLTSTNTGLNLNQDLTFSMWARDDGNGESEPSLVQVDDGNLFIGYFIESYVGDGAIGAMGGSSGTQGEAIFATTGLIDGSWGYCVNTFDQSTGYFDLFINGVDISWEYYDSYDPPTSNRITFGARTNSTNNFDGALCEFGIRTGLVTKNVTDTEYNMMNDPASFASSGTPETAGGDTALALTDGSHGHGVDNLALAQNYIIEPNDATHGQDAENLALDANIVLAISDSSHGQSAGSCDPVENLGLLPGNNTHTHSADVISIVQLHQVNIVETTHAHDAEDIVLGQIHQLAPEDIYHHQISDGCNVGEFISLILASADHVFISDTLDINQFHLVATDGTVHSLNSQNLSLSSASDLVIPDVAHGHQVENLTLDNGTTMQGHSSVHALLDAGLSIGYNVNLVASDTIQTHFVDQVLVTQNHMLLVQGADHSLSCDDPSLQTVVNGDDNMHFQSSDTPDLSQVHILQEINDHLLHSAREPYVRIPLGIWGFVGEAMSSWDTLSEASNNWTELAETSNEWEDQ